MAVGYASNQQPETVVTESTNSSLSAAKTQAAPDAETVPIKSMPDVNDEKPQPSIQMVRVKIEDDGDTESAKKKKASPVKRSASKRLKLEDDEE